MKEKNNIEVLVSTMHLKNSKDLINKMKINQAVIINQCDEEEKIKDINQEKFKVFSYVERGLSKSRNKALKNSSADICVIADDDMEYVENYEKIINEAYNKYKDADIIAFYVDNVDKSLYRPKRKERKINFLQSMRIKSGQITFKRKSIIDNKIKFNEQFGAGTDLYMGEENIFLAKCLEKGLKIYYIPQKIATYIENESTWFKGIEKKYFEVKGAMYYEMSSYLYIPLIFQFAIRKQKMYKDKITLFQAIKYMIEGKQKYKKMNKKKVYFLGDFVSNTGPANVNKNYYPFVKEKCHICKSNNKLKRVIHYIFNEKHIDTIIISSLSRFHKYICERANKKGKKVLYLMHGYHKLEDNINNETEGLTDENEEFILKNCDKIICVSEKFSEILKSDRPELKNKIEFVNSGVNIKETRIANKKVNEKYVIMSVGGGVRIKNNLNVCKAINLLKNDNIEFIVVGKLGIDGEKIKEYSFVKYYEYLDNKEVLEKMKNANLYIQNSSNETFGLAIIESISEGCDILISKNIGMLSIMNEVDNKYIIQDVNSIQEIKEKITYVMNNSNNEKFYKQIFLKENSYEESAKKLIDKCK